MWGRAVGQGGGACPQFLAGKGQLVTRTGLGDLGWRGSTHASLVTDEFRDMVLGDMS
jgi:hypothetical protein